jgi:hypothetical protein
MQMKLFLAATFFIVWAQIGSGADVVVAEKGAIVAIISETKILENANAYEKVVGLGVKFVSCRRVVYFNDQKPVCIAAEMVVESIDKSGKEPVTVTYPMWLWFDLAGKLCERAEPALLGDSLIPASPIVHHK